MPYKDPEARKACQRKAQAKYQRTPKGRATYARYNRSSKGRAAGIRYIRTEHGRIIRSMWGSSPRAKLRKRLYMQERKWKATQ